MTKRYSRKKRPIMEETELPMIALPLRRIPAIIDQLAAESTDMRGFDFSPKSLRRAEKYIERVRKLQSPVSEDELQLLFDNLTWMGYYVGEVIRRNLGGK